MGVHLPDLEGVGSQRTVWKVRAKVSDFWLTIRSYDYRPNDDEIEAVIEPSAHARWRLVRIDEEVAEEGRHVVEREATTAKAEVTEGDGD